MGCFEPSRISLFCLLLTHALFSDPISTIVPSSDIPLQTEKTSDSAELLRSRMSEIEACVIRVTKAAKVIDQESIILEVVKKLSNRFLAEKSMVKDGIDRLVEKEYLRKREGENVFEYI